MAREPQLFVVMGLARSGVAVAKLLLGLGKRVRVTDQRPESDFAHEISELETADGGRGRLELYLGGHPDSVLDGAECLVPSPGVPVGAALVRKAAQVGVPVWGEVEVAYRHLRGTVLGVTGSNGKSTTTALTAHILVSAGRMAVAAGNIGRALSGCLGQDSPESVYVTELSSFQLETVHSFHPRVGAILNITPDHLDRHHSMAEYEKAKWNLFLNMGEGDSAVLNARDQRLRDGSHKLACPVFWFDGRPEAPPGGSFRGAWAWDCGVWLNLGGGAVRVMGCDEIPLPGSHNLENVLAAAAVAGLAGASAPAIRDGVRSFKALPHRLEPVGIVGGRRFYNDSKATNVDSAVLAVQSFSEQIVLILGGKGKGSPYSPLVAAMRGRVRHCLLIGSAADKIASELGGGIPHTRCAGLAEAVRLGFELAGEGEVVLLSPACASYDMFRDYEHRGEVFRAEVSRLEAPCRC